MTTSAYMIAHCDDDFLQAAIASVIDRVDEVVFVDGAYAWVAPFFARAGPRSGAFVAKDARYPCRLRRTRSNISAASGTTNCTSVLRLCPVQAATSLSASTPTNLRSRRRGLRRLPEVVEVGGRDRISVRPSGPDIQRLDRAMTATPKQCCVLQGVGFPHAAGALRLFVAGADRRGTPALRPGPTGHGCTRHRSSVRRT